MKHLSFLLIAFLSISVFACQEKTNAEQLAIEELEKNIDNDPSTEHAQELVKKYDEYISTHPDDLENNPSYLYRAAALLYRMNRFTGAANKLQLSLLQYPESETTPMAAVFLGDIYREQMKNEATAVTAYQALIKAYPDSESAKKAFEKIPAGTPDLESRLQALGASIYNDSLNRIDYRIANSFISSSELYALILRNDESSPEVLYKAAEVARSVRSFNKALMLYERINEQYPGHEKSAQSLFMRAFTLDSDLHQVDKARELYQQFIDKYPEDDFVDDAQVLLDNLGKDDEEIIEAITKGQQDADENKQKQDKSQPELKEQATE
ncbi:MAG: tetratricopeptide repeat protein [Chitinophagales bacterium]|nr:tetratricopeptide repeat protein [Chitinophagales bacterium]